MAKSLIRAAGDGPAALRGALVVVLRNASRELLVLAFAVLSSASFTGLGLVESGPPADSVGMEMGESASFAAPHLPQPQAGAAPALPFWFEANTGQAPAEFLFVAHGAPLWVSQDAIVFGDTAPVSLNFPSPAAPVPEDALGSFSGHIAGDPSEWTFGVPHYGALRFAQVAPGIDILLYATGDGTPEFDVIAQPGADIAGFRLGIEGHESVRLLDDGALGITAGSTHRLEAPESYQPVGDARIAVASSYVLDGDQMGFDVDWQYPQLPLVIDPKVTYGSYIGGLSTDYLYAVSSSPESPDFLYVTGLTFSTNFPTKGAGTAWDWTYGGSDAYVAKFDTSKSGAASLVWVNFLGGSTTDTGTAIDVDSTGVYVVGHTISWSGVKYPTTANAWKQMMATSYQDMFMTRLSHNGLSVPYSTLLGGDYLDYGYAVSAEGNGRVTVAGATQYRTGYTMAATKDAFQPTHSDITTGYNDGYVARFDTALSGPASVLYATFLGGRYPDHIYDVDTDSDGNAYVTGTAQNPGSALPYFPTSPGAFQGPTPPGSYEVFVSKIPASGGAGLPSLPFSTLLGGSSTDQGYGIAYRAPYVYATGYTYSTNFDVTPGTLKSTRTASDQADAWVAVLDPAASGSAQLVAGTYLGGSASPDNGADFGQSIHLDTQGDVRVFGQTTTPSFPNNGPPGYGGGIYDTFSAELTPDLTALKGSIRLGAPNQWNPIATSPQHPGDLNSLDESMVGHTAYPGGVASGLPFVNFAGSPAFMKAPYSSTTYDGVVFRIGPGSPAPACKGVPPLYRTVPIQFSSAETKPGDNPIDATGWKWWFDTAVRNDPLAPDIAYDRNGDGLQDGDYSANPVWTYPAGVPPGEHIVKVTAQDTSGLPPGTGTCKVKLVNRPPVATIHLAQPPLYLKSSTVTARGPTPSQDFDAVDPFAGLTYEWVLPIQENCAPVSGKLYEVQCSWDLWETYEFILIVEDLDGAAGYTQLKVQVRDPMPQPDFTVPTEPVKLCEAPRAVHFTDLSVGEDTPIRSWAWDFGDDGTIDSRIQHPTWSVATPGTHKLRLTVTDEQGFKGTLVKEFTAVELGRPDARLRTDLHGTIFLGAPIFFEDHSVPHTGGDLVWREWDFKDGAKSVLANPTHTLAAAGDYNVTLTVRGSKGCEHTAEVRFKVIDLRTIPREVVEPPVALVAVIDGARHAIVGELARFRDLTLPQGAPLDEPAWDFGDGSESQHDREEEHRFQEAGTYTVTLAVFDVVGRTASAEHTIEVRPVDAPDPFATILVPIADAGSDEAAFGRAEVRLDGRASLAPSGRDLGFSWEQLQGPPVSLTGAGTAMATFTTPDVESGAVPLVFRLTVADGGQRSVPDLVTVRVVPYQPPGFTTNVLSGGLVEFTADVPEGIPTAWEFGDGSTSQDTNPDHTYPASGTYKVRMVAGDAGESSEQDVVVDVRSGLASRTGGAGESEAPLTFAGLPVLGAFGIFLGAAVVVGGTLLLVVRLAGRKA